MAFLRLGDNAATYPALLRIAALPASSGMQDVNMVFGWLVRCAAQSAGHMTDGLIDVGTAWMMGGPDTTDMAEMAVSVGLLTPVADGWQLLDDPEFIHIRSRAEILWTRQRDRDRHNDALTLPVRARDGDACRYCRTVVKEYDHTSSRGLTFDHIEPGQPATLENYVVCCKACNEKFSDGSHADLLWPPPSEPFYHPKTIEKLAKNGFEVVSGPKPIPQVIAPGPDRASARPPQAAQSADPSVDRASARPGGNGSHSMGSPGASAPPHAHHPGPGSDHAPAHSPAEGQAAITRRPSLRPGPGSDHAPTGGTATHPTGTHGSPTGPGGGTSVGSGRDGSGRVGSGGARRRGRRGGRRRGGGGSG